MARVPIEPDTKDWTWVLREPCPDCGFDAAGVEPTDLPALIRDTVPGFLAALDDVDARVRPADNVWSPLEYACHVRDVHVLFDLRLRQMLGDDDPLFANWDQDATAVADDYAGQDPAAVAPALAAAAELVAATYDGISGDQWQRPGRRSDGSVFTAESLGRYHLHDVVHHLHDIGHDPRSMTVAAYSGSAAAYAAGTAAMPDSVQRVLDRFAATLGAGARVLEIGSGPGRDALALEAAGLRVRRTDVTPGFVELLESQGHPADLLDPLTDDLIDPADPRLYDGGVGQRLPAARGASGPAGGAVPAGGGDPAGRAVPAVPQGGRRGALVDARPCRGSAVLHLLARGAAARGPRRRRLVGAHPRARGRAARRVVARGPRGAPGMRHTEFWARLDAALGPAYSRSWAGTFVITELGRTADEALAAGVPPKQVWAAVWSALELPPTDR